MSNTQDIPSKGRELEAGEDFLTFLDSQPFDEQHIVYMYMESGKTQYTCTYMLIKARFKNMHRHFYQSQHLTSVVQDRNNTSLLL